VTRIVCAALVLALVLSLTSAVAVAPRFAAPCTEIQFPERVCFIWRPGFRSPVAKPFIHVNRPDIVYQV
jgi:hypothetical protein